MPNKKRALEIDENIHFQRREWLFQRIGVALLFLLVTAALFGLTGAGGPLSRAEAGDPEGAVHVEYERIVRRGSKSTMTVHLRGGRGDVQFWVAAPYFKHVVVDTVAPTPTVVAVEPTRHVYTIRAGAAPVAVMMHVEHTTAGRVDAEVGLIEGPSVSFTQWSMF